MSASSILLHTTSKILDEVFEMYYVYLFLLPSSVFIILYRLGFAFTESMNGTIHQGPGRTKFHQGGQNNPPGRVSQGLLQRDFSTHYECPVGFPIFTVSIDLRRKKVSSLRKERNNDLNQNPKISILAV